MVESTFWKQLKLADLLTLANALSGTFAIFSVLQGKVGLASGLILFALVFDYLDGKVSRLAKKASVIGKELDSLADIISFGVAPATLVISLDMSWPFLAGGLFLVMAGLLRLARYNVSGKSDGFEGMPIPMNGVIFPVLVYLGLPLVYYPYLLVLSAILMVSSIKIPRLF